jgi:hypothetical protein
MLWSMGRALGAFVTDMVGAYNFWPGCLGLVERGGGGG